MSPLTGVLQRARVSRRPSLPLALDWAFASARRTWWSVFLLVGLMYLLTAHWTSGQVNDTVAAIWPAWNVVHHGSFFLDGVHVPDIVWFREVHGHLVSNRMMGVVVSGVPVSAGLSWTPLTPAQLNALNGALLTAVAVACLALVFRRLAAPRLAAAATVVVAFGTPLWTTAAAETWTHSVNALFLALALLMVSRDRFWLTGLALAPALMTRPHLALVAFVLGVGLGLHRRSMRPAVAIGVPATAAVGVLVLWNRWMFGAATIGGAYAGKLETATRVPSGGSEISAYVRNALAAAFTPDLGLFVFTPVALLALVWISRYWRRVPDWARLALLGGVLYQLMQLRLNGYSGGGQFYGNRLVVELVVLAAPAALAAYRPWSAGHVWRRFTGSVLAGIGVATFAVGAFLADYLVGTGTRSDWTVYYPATVVHAAGMTGSLAAGVIASCLLMFAFVQYRQARSAR